MIYAMTCLYLLFVSVYVLMINADTPANCMYEDIKGSWTFYLGPNTFDNSVNCNLSFPTTSTYNIKLQYPDIVYDNKGNQGFWTMIYNQGFEVNINGRTFFAFSAFSGNTSYCAKTLPGWYYNNNRQNWGCYYGSKTSGEEIKAVESSVNYDYIHSEERLNKKFQRDQKLVDHIHANTKLWTATHYEEYESMTIGQLEKRMGGASKVSVKDVMKHTVSSDNAEPRQRALRDMSSLPKSWDWTNVDGYNFVSPVRDQGQCGSCWTYASTGQVESRLRILTNNSLTPVLSTQNVVSCNQYGQGCDGGFSYLSGKYAKDFGYIEDSCMPYQGVNAPCQYCANPQRYRVRSYSYTGGYFGACNELEMMNDLIENGPLAVAFEVYDDFIHYKGGVYHHTGTQGVGFNPFVLTNHAVLLVGYGTVPGVDNDTPYWRVKNSWGTKWGEEGYFRIVRGGPGAGGECAIESMAVNIDPIVPHY